MPIYSDSLRKIQVNPRKIYTVDAAMAYTQMLTPKRNIGHIFENLVYLDLRRYGYKPAYYMTKDQHEVDFIAHDLLGNTQLLQVSWDMEDPETKEREMRALAQAEKELGIKGNIITPDNYYDWLENIQANH